MAIAPQALHEALLDAASALGETRIAHLFSEVPDRADRYRCEAGGLSLDFSKHLLSDDAWQSLLELASARALPEAFSSLIAGQIVNTSERRPALYKPTFSIVFLHSYSTDGYQF